MEYQQKKLTREEYEALLSTAAGDLEAELVLKNARYLDVFTNQFKTGDIAIYKGCFAGIGKYKGKQEIDLTGKTIVPGFIDAHIHIESTTVVPQVFAKEAIKHGTTAVLTDPHEIANVMGVDGIKYMLEATEGLPVDVFFMIPSCVPSCEFDESGAMILAEDMEPFFSNSRVYGIAEMMDVNGVVSRNRNVTDKTYLAITNNMLIDGHAPLITGQQLMGYVAAGVLSDHECSNKEEALEKLGIGLWIMIREGTAAQNLEALIDLCQEPFASRCMFCTDDRHINDIMDYGHIDHIIRKAISLGVDPVIAYKMASCSAGTYFGLRDRGAIAPGFLADFVVLNDVNSVDIHSVYKAGVEMTEELLEERCISKISKALIKKSHDTFHLPKITPIMLFNEKEVPAVGLVNGQIYTKHCKKVKEIDVSKDFLKVAVVERHRNTGHIGIGFINGYGLKKGSIATSVSHDAHNIIAIGANDEDIAAAINALAEMKGGMVVYSDGVVQAAYPMPVAGLMSETDAITAKELLDRVHAAAYELGVGKGIDPFMTLSFTALPVIPEIRITTLGVLNVSTWEMFSYYTDF